LNNSTQADDWADEFMKVYESGAEIDWGLMVGWFANCIEVAKRIESERHG
jgi:hypothetical protein